MTDQELAAFLERVADNYERSSPAEATLARLAAERLRAAAVWQAVVRRILCVDCLDEHASYPESVSCYCHCHEDTKEASYPKHKATMDQAKKLLEDPA